MSEKKYKGIGDIYTRLSEECAELIQICCKIKRFGIYNHHPITKKTNISLLREEIKDVKSVIRELKKFLG